MDGNVVAGILGIVAISIAPIAVFCLLDWGAKKMRTHGTITPRPLHDGPAPMSRPIESIARDVRRLAHETRSIAPGVSAVRAEGIWAAYDDVLAECCASLQVPCAIAETPPGPRRDGERTRVELLLYDAGLVLDNAA